MDQAKEGFGQARAASGHPGCSIVASLIFFALPITSIVLGAQYLDACTIEPYIPIYLLVAGSFGVYLGVSRLLTAIHGLCASKQGGGDCETGEDAAAAGQEPPKRPVLRALAGTEGIVSSFLFCWFIAGCVWVYRVYSTVNLDDPASPAYCHRTLYLYSFWLLNVTWIMCALIPLACCFVCCCCLCCCSCMKKGQQQEGYDLK